ncbi:large ribosomal subunit protein bL9-like [Oscarella lobularis]|uniref:large ribosomal subunit protein bL9-like n=1 Tax=Oscarella lobularis TaxID=121494 RepID=UPI00331342F7
MLCRAFSRLNLRHLGTKKESKLWRQKPNRKPRIRVRLIKDVDGVGQKGEEIVAKRGFARNYLLPSRNAVYALNSSSSRDDHVPSDLQESESPNQSDNKKILQFLKKSAVTVSRPRDDEVAIYPWDLVSACRKQLQLHVPREAVSFEGDAPRLSAFGNHQAYIKVSPSLTTTLGVSVVQDSTIRAKDRKLQKTSTPL